MGLLWLLLLPLVAGYSAALNDRSPRVAALLADLAQYLSSLIIGLLYWVLLSMLMTYGPGVSIWGFGLVLLSFLLAGYLSALSLLAPRLAAIIAGITVLPFLLAGLYDLLRKTPTFVRQPLNLIFPGAIVLGISVFMLYRSGPSLWSRQKGLLGKIIVAAFVLLPALWATSALFSVAMWVSRRE